MTPKGQRFLGWLSLIVLIGAFIVAWSSADQCSRTEDCGGYRATYNKSTEGGFQELTHGETAEELLARYTLWLALFTGALVITSVFQGYFLIRADRTARTVANAALATATAIGTQNTHILNSITEAKRAADAMNDVATEMGKNAKAALASAQLAQQEFASTHRPKLFIRNIQPRVLGADQKIVIRFTIFNRGEIAANKIIWRMGTIILDKGQNVYGMEGIDAVDVPFIYPLVGGEDVTEDFESTKPLSPTDHYLIVSGGRVLFFCGVIAYQDSSGITRRSGFMRRYDASVSRFDTTADYDAEYEY